MEHFCSKVSNNLNDYFEVYHVGSQPRLRFKLNRDVFKSFFKENVFYTIFEKRKVFFYLKDGKELLLMNFKFLLSASKIIQQIIDDIVFDASDQYQVGFHYNDYVNVLYDHCKGLPYRVVTSWITERKPSDIFIWKIEYEFDRYFFIKKTNELLLQELKLADFKITKDCTGNLFSQGDDIYYKSLGENYYVLFCEITGSNTIDSRIVQTNDIENVSLNYSIPVKKFPVYGERQKSFILGFDLAIYYPILSNIILDARKYDFFYDIVSDYDKKIINENKAKVGW